MKLFDAHPLSPSLQGAPSQKRRVGLLAAVVLACMPAWVMA
jgi:hypothetical protein